MNKTFLRSTLLAVAAFLLSTTSSASTIKLTDVNHALPRSGVYAGLYTLNIDGQNVLAMCDDFNTSIYIGLQWTAVPYDYSQIVAGAPVKFASGGISKYSEIGYLFSLVPTSTASQQADINLAVWRIMTPTAALSLTGNALTYFNTATGGTYNTFDYTNYMRVWTPNPLNASQEFLGASPTVVPPSSVPLPSGLWLFVSGLAGMVGSLRRKGLTRSV